MDDGVPTGNEVGGPWWLCFGFFMVREVCVVFEAPKISNSVICSCCLVDLLLGQLTTKTKEK